MKKKRPGHRADISQEGSEDYSVLYFNFVPNKNLKIII